MGTVLEDEPKPVNFLCLDVGNDSHHDVAENPSLSFKIGEKEKGWFKALSTNLDTKELDLEILRLPILVRGEEAYAHAIIKQGLEPVPSIGQGSSEAFVVGFVIKGSKTFYLVNPHRAFPFPMPIIIRMEIFVQTPTEGYSNLSETGFLVKATDFDNVSIAKDKGSLF